jgi:hypothetical protein
LLFSHFTRDLDRVFDILLMLKVGFKGMAKVDDNRERVAAAAAVAEE